MEVVPCCRRRSLPLLDVPTKDSMPADLLRTQSDNAFFNLLESVPFCFHKVGALLRGHDRVELSELGPPGQRLAPEAGTVKASRNPLHRPDHQEGAKTRQCVSQAPTSSRHPLHLNMYMSPRFLGSPNLKSARGSVAISAGRLERPDLRHVKINRLALSESNTGQSRLCARPRWPRLRA